MFISNQEYGKVKINSYLPTQKAIKFLNYFTTAGWHDCNTLYHQKYKNGGPGSLMIFTVGGKGVLKIPDQSFVLSVGNIALVPPNTPMEYYTHPDGRWEFYWINLFGTNAFQMVQYILEVYGSIFYTGQIIEMQNKMKELIQLTGGNKFDFELEVSKKITDLMYLMLRDLFYAESDRRLSGHITNEIACYLEQHFAEAINLLTLSKKFFMSKNQIIQKFQSELGYTPYEYLKRHRLLKSCELLQLTDETIEAIGKQVGFLNSSNFIYQFKAQYGITPQKYRKYFSPVREKTSYS